MAAPSCPSSCSPPFLCLVSSSLPVPVGQGFQVSVLWCMSSFHEHLAPTFSLCPHHFSLFCTSATRVSASPTPEQLHLEAFVFVLTLDTLWIPWIISLEGGFGSPHPSSLLPCQILRLLPRADIWLALVSPLLSFKASSR